MLAAFLAAAAAGCQAAPPQSAQPVVSGTRDAMARATDYCRQHDLNWGQPIFIIQQMDGYYVEFVTESGYKQVNRGLTVDYDGTVHE